MAQVPDGATVLTTLDLLAPLAARTDTYWIGNSGNPQTQYIVFDGLDSDYSPAIKNVPAFIASLVPARHLHRDLLLRRRLRLPPHPLLTGRAGTRQAYRGHRLARLVARRHRWIG